ncbi:hypothetical protein [Micromonospora siamensis]|uniref:Uncharacterized protein n=1 Tax=Micromonospora siamensis TaxID=299152 RepID=A0A1C5J9E6_9ACTN|nr:hypothetical protein [Micromonospora siamensis]SCG67202.1 hypothetical protein GA0074704_4266 [Micromonospora siamensis]
MSGWVDVYQRADGRIYVSSHSRVVNGPLVVNGWCRVVAPEATDGEVGSLVQEGLRVGEEPMRGISAEDVKELLRPLLKLAGVRSFAALARGTRAVGVERDESGSYVIVSTENRGVRTGFLFTDEKVTVPANSAVEEVGRAVRRGLGDSSIVATADQR